MPPRPRRSRTPGPRGFRGACGGYAAGCVFVRVSAGRRCSGCGCCGCCGWPGGWCHASASVCAGWVFVRVSARCWCSGCGWFCVCAGCVLVRLPAGARWWRRGASAAGCARRSRCSGARAERRGHRRCRHEQVGASFARGAGRGIDPAASAGSPGGARCAGGELESAARSRCAGGWVCAHPVRVGAGCRGAFGIGSTAAPGRTVRSWWCADSASARGSGYVECVRRPGIPGCNGRATGFWWPGFVSVPGCAGWLRCSAAARCSGCSRHTAASWCPRCATDRAWSRASRGDRVVLTPGGRPRHSSSAASAPLSWRPRGPWNPGRFRGGSGCSAIDAARHDAAPAPGCRTVPGSGASARAAGARAVSVRAAGAGTAHTWTARARAVSVRAADVGTARPGSVLAR